MTTCIFIAIPKDYDISYSSTEKLLCAVDGNWYRDKKKKLFKVQKTRVLTALDILNGISLSYLFLPRLGNHCGRYGRETINVRGSR